MERWQWEELEAQVEDNGFNKITFIVWDISNTEYRNAEPGEYELQVVEVKFEDGLIKVVLE